MTRKLASALTVFVGAATLATGLGFSQPAAAVTPFIGNIRYFAFNFEPAGWAFCDGQLMAVSANDTLFSLIGTTYGGDGSTTFALPDMRGRFPVHQGTGPGLSTRVMGQRGGQERVTLTANQIGHTHTLRANTGEGNESVPTGHSLAQDGADTTYRNEAPDVAMHADSITHTGGGQAHPNMPPFLGVNCNIALSGIFPTRN